MYGYEWSFRDLWRLMNWLQRLDVIVLALMLAHIVAVLIHVSYRYRLARRAEVIDSASTAFRSGRRKLVADLSIKVSTLNSIALVAPYLGLAGTSIGIMTAFRGIGIVAESALAAVIISGVVPVAFITTVAGLLVAIPAAWSYNYLRTRIDLLESEIPSDAPRRTRHFTVPQELPLAARFSRIPFPLVAAPSLAILVGVVFMEYSSYETPKGLYVGITSAPLRCEYEGGDRRIVLRITNASKLFLNTEQEEWNSLSSRLSAVYSPRAYRTLYLVADDAVSFQTVADAIDIAENAQVKGGAGSLDITVRLITPRAVNTRCPEIANQHVLK
jgi:biopolymer transport protein ExbB/TolQ/biopolymer transport protein ExbD